MEDPSVPVKIGKMDPAAADETKRESEQRNERTDKLIARSETVTSGPSSMLEDDGENSDRDEDEGDCSISSVDDEEENEAGDGIEPALMRDADLVQSSTSKDKGKDKADSEDVENKRNNLESDYMRGDFQRLDIGSKQEEHDFALAVQLQEQYNGQANAVAQEILSGSPILGMEVRDDVEAARKAAQEKADLEFAMEVNRQLNRGQGPEQEPEHLQSPTQRCQTEDDSSENTSLQSTDTRMEPLPPQPKGDDAKPAEEGKSNSDSQDRDGEKNSYLQPQFSAPVVLASSGAASSNVLGSTPSPLSTGSSGTSSSASGPATGSGVYGYFPFKTKDAKLPKSPEPNIEDPPPFSSPLMTPPEKDPLYLARCTCTYITYNKQGIKTQLRPGSSSAEKGSSGTMGEEVRRVHKMCDICRNKESDTVQTPRLSGIYTPGGSCQGSFIY